MIYNITDIEWDNEYPGAGDQPVATTARITHIQNFHSKAYIVEKAENQVGGMGWLIKTCKIAEEVKVKKVEV